MSEPVVVQWKDGDLKAGIQAGWYCEILPSVWRDLEDLVVYLQAINPTAEIHIIPA